MKLGFDFKKIISDMHNKDMCRQVLETNLIINITITNIR